MPVVASAFFRKITFCSYLFDGYATGKQKHLCGRTRLLRIKRTRKNGVKQCWIFFKPRDEKKPGMIYLLWVDLFFLRLRGLRQLGQLRQLRPHGRQRPSHSNKPSWDFSLFSAKRKKLQKRCRAKKQTNKRTNERRLLANLENSEQRAPFFRREKKKSTGVTSDDERRDVVDDDDEVADITQRRDARNTLSQLVDFRSKIFASEPSRSLPPFLFNT